MTKAENPDIVPYFDKIFNQNLNCSHDQLNTFLKDYFLEISKSFCLFFPKLETLTNLTSRLDDGLTIHKDFLIFDKLKPQKSSNKEKNEFDKYNFNGAPICKDCQLANSTDIDQNEMKLNNKYGNCQLSLTIDCKQNEKLDNKFSENFSNLMLLNVTRPKDFEGSLFDNLTRLKLLEIKEDKLKSLPSHIFAIKTLTTLILSNSSIHSFRNIREKIQLAESLRLLQIENIQLKKLKKLIKLPASLKKLHLISMRSNQIPFQLENSSITSLKCTGVPWKADLKATIYFDQFKKEYERFFPDNQLLDIFKAFDKNNDGCIGELELTKFNAYIFKRFERLGSETVNSLEADDDEYVQTDGEPCGIPKFIFNMEALVTLDFSYQAIKAIPDEIQNLKNLNSLILESCIMLNSISPKLANLPITQLNLSNCISLKTPPPEIQVK